LIDRNLVFSLIHVSKQIMHVRDSVVVYCRGEIKKWWLLVIRERERGGNNHHSSGQGQAHLSHYFLSTTWSDSELCGVTGVVFSSSPIMQQLLLNYTLEKGQTIKKKKSVRISNGRLVCYT